MAYFVANWATSLKQPNRKRGYQLTDSESALANVRQVALLVRPDPGL